MTAALHVLVTLACLAIAPICAGQPRNEREAAMMEDSLRARNLAMAVHVYHQEHASLPPDLGSLSPYLGDNEDAVAARLISPHDRPPRREGELGAWLNEHASFRYLGLAGVTLEEVSDWDRTVIGHLRLDLAHPGEAGPGVPVAFLDGRVEVLPPETAAALIEESRQVFTALATGGRLPDGRQALWNLRRISEALGAYARAHEGRLPPDLADALPYIPGGKGASTPQEKARVFLSPKAARNTAIPDEPTVEWVRQHSAWQYLGAGPAPGPEALGAPLALIEDPQATVLVHSRLTDAARRPGDPRQFVPAATASGAVELIERDFATWRIDQSRKVIEFARTGGASPLPDLQHAMRDLRLLSRALQRYADMSDGALPDRLSDLYDLLEDPELDLSPAQRARVFLTPTAERLAPPPETDLAAWLAERANYRLAPSPAAQREAGSHPAPVLLHQPLTEPLTTRAEGGELEVIVVADAAGRVLALPLDAAERWIRGER